MDSAEELSVVLKKKRMTLSLAESCTGGMISSMMVGIPGASEFFLGSAVTYSNASKAAVLGVSEDTLKRHGAVSAETAAEMAAGAARVFRSDVSAAVTCIAGLVTDGGPAGLTFIAVHRGDVTRTFTDIYKGNRDEIRRAVSEALIERVLEAVR